MYIELRARCGSALTRGLARLPPGLLRLLVGKPVAIDGQHLDIEAQLFLKRLALVGGPPLEMLSVADARGRVARDMRTFEGRKPKISAEEITVGGAAGSLGARLYTPNGA